MRYGRVEAVAVANNHLRARLFASRLHAGACCKRQSHGLLDQHVLALARRESHMLLMQLMRCGDVDPFNVRIGAKRFGRCVRHPAERLGEGCGGVGVRIEAGSQRDARILAERRDHQGEGTAKTQDTEPDGLLVGIH